MRWHLIFTLAILAFVLPGCAHSVSSSSGIDYIAVQMWASTNCTQPGDKINLRATVTNNGTQTETVELTDQPVLDIIVGNQRPIVHWSDGKPLTPDLTRLELKPGESKSIEMDWTVKQPTTFTVFDVSASFVYDPKAPSGPVSPGVLINIGNCPGPFGP